MGSNERLPPPALDALGDEARGLAALIEGAEQAGAFSFRTKDDDGALIGLFRVLVYAPHLGESIARIGLAIDSSDTLPERARHAAILAVAAHEKSEYEWYSHELQAQGSLTAYEIERLRSGEEITFPDHAEQLCHDVVRSVLETGDVSDALYAEAVSRLGYRAVTELVWIIGLYTASARQLRVHRLGAPVPSADTQ